MKLQEYQAALAELEAQKPEDYPAEGAPGTINIDVSGAVCINVITSSFEDLKKIRDWLTTVIDG